MRWRNILPDGDTEVRHGHSIRTLRRLALIASTMRHPPVLSHDQKIDAAWCAMVDYLFTADSRPDEQVLLTQALGGISKEATAVLRAEGISRQRSGEYEPMPHFLRYWWFSQRNSPSCETHVVDDLALQQIWPQLKPIHQEALVALATHGDYGLAARWLGIQPNSYHSRISQARSAFRQLWHEGESPSRQWGRDTPGRGRFKAIRERSRRSRRGDAA